MANSGSVRCHVPLQAHCQTSKLRCTSGYLCLASLTSSTARFTSTLSVFPHIISWIHSLTYSGRLRAPLSQVFPQVVLFESTALACDQCEAGVGDKDPNNGGTGISIVRAKARLCSRRVDAYQAVFVRGQCKTKMLGNRIPACKEADRGCAQPRIRLCPGSGLGAWSPGRTASSRACRPTKLCSFLRQRF